MKWKLVTFTKDATRQKQPQRAERISSFLREQLDEMTEDQKNYCSIVLKRWNEIKEDPARLSEYNDKAIHIKNEAEKPDDDS